MPLRAGNTLIALYALNAPLTRITLESLLTGHRLWSLELDERVTVAEPGDRRYTCLSTLPVR